jgi:hypothetical protein
VPSDLIDLEELAEQCGLAPDSDDVALLGALGEQVVKAFERQIGRSDRPFQKSQTGRVEIKDGTGSALLYLDYPLKNSLTAAITLGYNSAAWDETLDPADVTKLTWKVGATRIQRVDGCRFGCLGQPNYIRVTYDTQDDLPDDVVLAVARMTKALYQELKTPDAIGDRELEANQVLPLVSDRDPFWQMALDAHASPRV